MRTPVTLCFALTLIACGPSPLVFDAAPGGDAPTNGDPDAGAGGGSDAGGAPPMNCDPSSPDLQGCACSTTEFGTTHACYPASADPTTRNTGACHDGTQPCVMQNEFTMWGACEGAVTPNPEACANGIDDNCNGTIDCNDPSCATDPACHTACSDGDMRACYTGPDGTAGVGTCHGGTQVCTGGAWPTDCPGEVLPAAEDCTSPLDLNCNHLAGCFDLFACILSPACQATCMVTDPSCVCPTGTGDVATCPDGMWGVVMGSSPGVPGTIECCPCTASDCTNPGCCAEPVCAGNPWCAGLDCTAPLPASCGGMVNFDCDDFPEDCDEPCCKCTMCSGV